MYMHLGAETVVKQSEIVGIFDMEATTISKNSRDFLKKATKNRRIVNVSFEMPKSFIVCEDRKTREQTVYISPLSASTLQKRYAAKSGF